MLSGAGEEADRGGGGVVHLGEGWDGGDAGRADIEVAAVHDRILVSPRDLHSGAEKRIVTLLPSEIFGLHINVL